MAATAKLAVARGGTPTTTTRRHRVSTALAVSSATPITVSLSGLQQHKQQEQAAAPSSTEAPPPAAGSSVRANKAMATPPPPLACMWQELQGAGDDWRALVEPLHPLLRAEIVRYAELVAACYRTFDLDPRSKRYLNCKHGKQQMLQAAAAAGMHGAAGYAVTKYIYAAPAAVAFGRRRRSCSSKGRWIGYVAVASDGEAARLGRRDIVVSFRGTVTGSEWLANFMSTLAPARFDPADPRPDVRVESGFLSLYSSDDAFGKFTAGSCRNQVLSEISSLVAKHKGEEMSITLAGHSMGSSLALLLGYDLAELGLNSYPNRSSSTTTTIPITVYSFAGPRVGNLEFKNRCDELGVKVIRVVNVNDPVTKMPGVLFNEGARVLAGRYELPWSKACYVHVGVEVALDFFEAGDIAYAHDLQAYIDQLILIKCTDDDDVTVAVVGSDDDSIMDEEEEGGGVSGGRVVASVFESWRWQMAAIRAGEFMQALGI